MPPKVTSDLPREKRIPRLDVDDYAEHQWNATQLASEFGLKRNNTKMWRSKGCPHKKVGNRVIFNIMEVAEWYGINELISCAIANDNHKLADWLIAKLPSEQPYSDPGTGDKLVTMSYEEARTKKITAEAGIKQIQLAKEQSLAVSIEDVRKSWEKVVGATRQRLLALPTRVAPLIEACGSKSEVEELLNIKIREALLGLSDKDLGTK